MKGTIALEEGLSGLKKELEQRGYQVIDMEQKDKLRIADAVVTTGLDQNVTLREDIKTEATVINASGKSTPEIIEDIEKSIPVR